MLIKLYVSSADTNFSYRSAKIKKRSDYLLGSRDGFPIAGDSNVSIASAVKCNYSVLG